MSRIIAFLVWALAAASAVFWGLRVFSQPLAVPPHAQPVAPAEGSPAAVARLFAAPPDAATAGDAGAPAVAASSRFQLLGVMAPPKGQGGGVALISVDGQPPRTYRPGTPVAEGFVLQRLGQRSATLGSARGGGGFTLELPPMPPPNTGALPRAGNGTPGTAATRPAPPPPAPATRRPPREEADVEAESDEPQPGKPLESAPDADEEPSHRRPS